MNIWTRRATDTANGGESSYQCPNCETELERKDILQREKCPGCYFHYTTLIRMDYSGYFEESDLRLDAIFEDLIESKEEKTYRDLYLALSALQSDDAYAAAECFSRVAENLWDRERTHA